MDPQIQRRPPHPLGREEDPLPDGLLTADRRRAQDRIVHRHGAGHRNLEPLRGQRLRDQPFSLRPLCRVLGQEEIPDPERPRHELPPGETRKKPERQIDRNPGAITDPLSRHPSPMRHRAKRLMPKDQNVMGLHAVFAGEKPDAAAAPVRRRIMKASPDGVFANVIVVHDMPLPHRSRSLGKSANGTG